MTESIDELGPVDYLVVEFPGSNFTGQIMPELVNLVQRGIVRVLDLVLIKKDNDGSYEAFEIADIEDGALGELRELERELAELQRGRCRRRRGDPGARQHRRATGVRESLGGTVRLGGPPIRRPAHLQRPNSSSIAPRRPGSAPG